MASKCRLFTDIDTAFIPIGRIVKTGGLKAVLEYYQELGTDFNKSVCSMLIFDAVIYNEDRHFGNFGLLRDNRTGKILSPAPIFDNGLSLFNYGMVDDFANLDEYAKTRAPAYGNVSFESICETVKGKAQTQQLRKLIGFTFERHLSWRTHQPSAYCIPACCLRCAGKRRSSWEQKIRVFFRFFHKPGEYSCFAFA